MGILKIWKPVMTAATCLMLLSCAAQKRLEDLSSRSVSATLSISGDAGDGIPETGKEEIEIPDTIEVHEFDGRTVILMNAVMDENGEMVATDVIKAATVTARFRNVAERHGKVDLSFTITVPEDIQYSDWQLRFRPYMAIMGDTLSLDPVMVTGAEYRKAQLKGYQRYERFLKSIVTDSSAFINIRLLELFLERNMPRLYAFRNDSTAVSEEEFRSSFGVTEEEAVRHYTNLLRAQANGRRIARKGKMFSRLVKSPIVTEGLRLDTIIRDPSGAFAYEYTQSVRSRPGLKKVDIILTGKAYMEDRCIYTMPCPEALTFYISSLSTLTDDSERFLTRVVERKAEANTACYIDFGSGSHTVDEDLGNNRTEIHRIKDNLASLLENREFDLDSIVVTASASPEGDAAYNERLSGQRAEAITDYFGAWMDRYADSLARESGVFISEDGKESVMQGRTVEMTSRSGGENWRMLEALVASDTVMTVQDKEIFAGLMPISDIDSREKALGKLPFYGHLRQHVYPRLRTVKFNFHLHRKGMIKDTVHTTEPDTAYMNGIQAIKDRDYERAVTLLRPYADYNTAVAYMSLDYNASALAILEGLEKTDRVNYLLAVLYGRKGEYEKAAAHYISACRQNRGMIHRGNLDPEIAALKRIYDIDKQITGNGYDD